MATENEQQKYAEVLDETIQLASACKIASDHFNNCVEPEYLYQQFDLAMQYDLIAKKAKELSELLTLA